MGALLEIIRILFILLLLGGIGGGIIGSIYRVNDTPESYWWLGGIAILILIFVLYRNKLQFSGWYKGKSSVKLSKPVSLTLIISSIILLILPLVLGSLLN